MPIPPQLLKAGYQSFADVRVKRNLPGLSRPGLVVSIEGETNHGKSELAMSCPGPGIALMVDRGHDAMMDNPEPPPTRRDDIAIREIALTISGMEVDHLENWKTYWNEYMTAISNPIIRTVIVDGDGDTWETQRLAAFGKTTQVPSIMYTGVNAMRKTMMTRAKDTGKFIVYTYKLMPHWAEMKDALGNPVLDNMGKPKREKNGVERNGFDNANYLIDLELRVLFKEPYFSKEAKRTIPHSFGVRILKSKANPGAVNSELWGDDCNMRTILELVYPQVSAKEWGY